MNSGFRYRQWVRWFIAAAVLSFSCGAVIADSAQAIDREADAALARLYAESSAAKKLSANAEAILIFPSIVKAGLGIGGQYGTGVLRRGGKSIGYYRSSALSYGLQAGAQTFSYVLFLMASGTLEYLESNDGWEIGVGPSVVIMDEGMAKTVTTSTTRDDIYAFVFGQKGLMAGMGLQGTKITPIEPDK